MNPNHNGETKKAFFFLHKAGTPWGSVFVGADRVPCPLKCISFF